MPKGVEHYGNAQNALNPLEEPDVQHSEFFWPTFTPLTTPMLTRVLFDPTPMTVQERG
jgi:hypothetical protein